MPQAALGFGFKVTDVPGLTNTGEPEPEVATRIYLHIWIFLPGHEKIKNTQAPAINLAIERLSQKNQP